jgi:hypothetical protein
LDRSFDMIPSNLGHIVFLKRFVFSVCEAHFHVKGYYNIIILVL